MPSELAERIVDALIPAVFEFAADFLGKKPNKKIRIRKKEKLKIAEGIDRWINAAQELESYRTPAKSPAEYISRLDRVGELYRPYMNLPKGVAFPHFLRDRLRKITVEVGQWSYFPRTHYRNIAANLDTLTSTVFASNAAAMDNLLSEFWNSPDGAVVLRMPYTAVIRRCMYLGNAKRRLDVSLIERLIETYREFSGLYEKAVRVVVGTMEVLNDKDITYAQLLKRPLSLNVEQMSRAYPWLTRDFDIVIRNSIAHTTYVVSHNSKTVMFRDNRASVIVSFRDLFSRCRMLSSLVVGLFLLNFFFYYWRWKRISEHYDQIKKSLRQDSSRF